MRKRAIPLLILVCTLAVIVSLFPLLFMLGFAYVNNAIPATIPEMASDFQSWVGKRVIVRGEFYSGLISLSEEIPPSNCVLMDRNARAAIGVRALLRGDCLFNHKNVTVVGIVTKGQTGPLIVRTVYYIDAEIIQGRL